MEIVATVVMMVMGGSRVRRRKGAVSGGVGFNIRRRIGTAVREGALPVVLIQFARVFLLSKKLGVG